MAVRRFCCAPIFRPKCTVTASSSLAMEQLGPTLTEFYSHTTSNERKHQLEQGLQAFQRQPTAVATVLDVVVSIVSGKG